MRFILTCAGGLLGIGGIYLYFTDSTLQLSPFESLVMLMLIAVFLLSLSGALSDGTENNQAHISRQVAETYEKAERAERSASQLLNAIVDMQQLYNEQLARVATGHGNNYEQDGDFKGGSSGYDRSYG